MTSISLGTGPTFDLDELVRTRLLVQGSSGSGKTHLLRRLLEDSADHVQQFIVDPEGEFTYLRGLVGHAVIDAEHHFAHLPALALRARERRISAVLDLSGLEPALQVAAVAEFLPAIFGAERDYWRPALVVIDEAHLFASGDMAGTKSVNQASASALANLMSRGRKRGLAGVLATQRVAKISKNVVAEALNLLVGRTYLDIDLKRVTTLLGLPKAEAGRFRDLGRGQFIGLGPALTTTPTLLGVGETAPAPSPLAGDPLGALSTLVSAPPCVEPCCAPGPAAGDLQEPLRSLLAALRATVAAGKPWPGYLSLARAVPGLTNSLHARALCDALAARGYLSLVDGLGGPTFVLPKG